MSEWRARHSGTEAKRRAGGRRPRERLGGPQARQEAATEREWAQLVAREVGRQARIEAVFDRADACERLGDLVRALDRLDEADALSGGLSASYRARRARLQRRVARRDQLGKAKGAAMTADTPDSSGDAPVGAPDRFGFALSGGVEAAAAARRGVIAGDGLVPASVREDVLLLVTELVTNAVRHAGVGPERPVRVEVMRLSRRVRVEVIDRGPGFDHEQAGPSLDGSGGWGLVLVDRIADCWGHAHGRAGSRVWFELRLEA